MTRSSSESIATLHKVVDERDERGHLQVFLPHAEVCISHVTGRLSHRMARRWIDVLDPHFARGVVFDTFHDWEAMTGYDSTARVALTNWVVANHGSVKSAHFLVGSRLVAMGVSAANLATVFVGLSLFAHATRADFDAALSAALASATRRKA